MNKPAEPSAEAIKFPKAVEFLLKEPMYREWKAEKENIWQLLALLYNNRTYDAYCVSCEKDATFQVIATERPAALVRDHQAEIARKKSGAPAVYPNPDDGVYTVRGTCTRNNGHLQSFLFLVNSEMDLNIWEMETTIQKIGQHPSYAELNGHRFKAFRKVLTPKLMVELNKAVGLAAYDVGVGAYAYLRRVFESLIEEARLHASKEPGWDQKKYQQARMTDKILILRESLPPFLVDNPGMYKLLSKGIHELTEEECLDNFPVLLLGTELILDERLQHQRKAQIIEEAKTALAAAAAKHK